MEGIILFPISLLRVNPETMRLKFILIAVLSIVCSVGCNDEDVDTDYSFHADQLTVVVTNANTDNGNVTEKFHNFLIENEYLIDFKFSGQSRKENNDKALARFEEKYKSLQLIDLVKIFSLSEGQDVTVKFLYSLTRGEEQIGETKEVNLNTSVVQKK